MIDFKINEQGDMSLKEQFRIKPFKINFTKGDFPKFKLFFRTNAANNTNPELKNFKVDFSTNFDDKTKYKCVDVVRGTEERSQSIAIRLKTELNELQNFFNDFGCELARMRHQDLINPKNHERIREYVENSITDIIGYNEATVRVDRLIPDAGNFKFETLKITIVGNDGKIIYTFTI